MHSGKPDRFRALIIALMAMIGIVLLWESVGLSQGADQKVVGADGFRELRWGASIEQSTKIYPDLAFEKYVVSGAREEPWKVYVRKREHGEIENVTFDSIEYWFKEDHFRRIRAVLNSRIGPRTMVTRAENAYDKVNAALRKRYGEPPDHRVDYVTEFIVVVREATWTVGPSAITIKYEGVGRINEDLFTLTMQEKRKK